MATHVRLNGFFSNRRICCLLDCIYNKAKLNYKQKYSHKDRLYPMSNVDASEENVEAPSTYGGQLIQNIERRKKKRQGKKK